MGFETFQKNRELGFYKKLVKNIDFEFRYKSIPDCKWKSTSGYTKNAIFNMLSDSALEFRNIKREPGIKEMPIFGKLKEVKEWKKKKTYIPVFAGIKADMV